MDPLHALIDQVAVNTSVEGSAKVLIDGFAARLAAAGTDPTKLAQLRADIKGADDALAASVAANTPAAPITAPTAAAKKKP